MNEGTKIQLSAREMELVTDTGWIFTKQQIIDKVYALFGQLHDLYRKIALSRQDRLPFKGAVPGGKISRGENYLGLPYVILDYPAAFHKNGTLAVRTFFWWGHFFSATLHLSGSYWKGNLLSAEAISFLREKNFYVCVDETEWHHHFEPSNFMPARELDDASLSNLAQKKFLKIAKKTDLTDWDLACGFLEETFEEILEFVSDFIPVSCPAGGTDL